MNLLTKFTEKNTSGKKVLGLFILTNTVYLYMLTVTIPKTIEFSNGIKLLDMMPTGYDLAYVSSLFSSLGKNGRETYLTSQIPVDMIYPLLFGLTYCLLLGYFLKKLNKLKPPLNYLCLLPIIAGIADYVENIGIITMLNNYSDITESMVNVTNTFSIIKSTSTSISFIVLILILIVIGIKYLKRNNTNLSNEI